MSFRDRFPVLAYWLGRKKYLLSTFFYRKNPRKWTEKQYKKKFHISLDLVNPKTFYDKINYWKLFYYEPAQTVLADKLAVKNYLKELGYGDLCAECYFSTNSIKEFKKWFSENKNVIGGFVIKTNHSCGDIYLYNNGLITKKYGRIIKKPSQMFKMLKMALKFNHYYARFEKPYKDIKPAIFVEELINFDDRTTEYEFMCNYGKVVATNIVKNRHDSKHSEFLVDDSFVTINGDCILGKKIDRPTNIAKIEEIIDKTTKQFPFCRIDFVESNRRLYFCEYTFVKSGGLNLYKPESFNEEFGSKFKL